MKNLPIRHVVPIYFPLLLNFWSTSSERAQRGASEEEHCGFPRNKQDIPAGVGEHRVPWCMVELHCPVGCTHAAGGSS